MSPDPATRAVVPPPPGGGPTGGPVGRPGGPPAQGLDAQTPLLLLPVNIETRFMDVGDGVSELWVRIYPDQIAIDSHEPELTLQEIADGQSYWTQVWSAGNPPPTADGAQAPWRALATIYGAPRAAWIALQLTPTNESQQPVAPATPGAAPNPAPLFPSPPTRASSWEKPAVADALPDAWTVVLVSGVQTASYQGGPISPVLAMSLTPLTGPLPPGTSPFPAGSPVDAGLQWLVDFDAALAAGMALKVPLSRDERAAGFDRILVYGLRTSGVGADDLAALLDAHHYTDGFALVPQGAPTKNTPDASSHFSRKDPDFAASFAYERQGPLTAQAGCDGDVFASLVGVDPAHLAHTQYADGVNVQNGQDMLTALWPSTLGYFFSQMMDPVFAAGQIDAAREYVLANTLPRGAAPAFRVGTTPYGVLPVTSLTRYKPSDLRSDVVQDGLVAFVTRLWATWLASSAGTPHMQTTGDPDAELIGLLGMDASSATFRGRQVMGTDFLWNYMTFLTFPLNAMQAWLADALSPGRLLLDTFGAGAWDPRLIHLGLSGNSFPVGAPTVQSGPLSETDPLTADANLGGGVNGNYIQWLAQASVADIQAQNYPGPTPTSLLYMILRQSLILGYGAPAAGAEIGAGRLQAAQFREAELVGIPVVTPPAHPTVGVWDLLARPSIPDPAHSWGDYLAVVAAPPSSPYGQVTALRASLGRLAGLPTAELDRLLTETLDACSHRLDVWASTVANAILNRTRTVGDIAGVHLGAFGWLEEIRPSPQRAQVVGPELAQVRGLDALRAKRVPGAAPLPTPVQPLTDNGGYVYCPSSEQAAVAAVLRNGYMTHKGTPEEPMLDIDLSSERVRYALSLLQGVQQGQSLNALLGYLFEAGLADLGLEQYTQPFRDLFPVVGKKLTPSSAPSEAVAASNVVDGLALRTAWDNGNLAAGQNWGTGLPPPGPDQTAVIGLLTTLDDYAHALGDVSMAEAVFQVIRGNFGRAGGLMDAISKGDRPPDPDVITTPRGGLDLTQRVAVLIAGAPAVAPAWSGVGLHPRAAAEPRLEAWLTGLLPDPSTVTCSVQYTASGAAQSASVSLLQLDVGALDCLAMADAAAIPQQGELEARILYAAAVPSGATAVQIDYQPVAPPAGWASFPDFFFLAKALRSLVSSARALGPQDITVPENDVSKAGLVDAVELQARATAALAGLHAHTATLAAAVGDAALRDALLTCAYYGVIGATPSTETDANLANQAKSVLGVLHARIATASAPGVAAVDMIGAIFGKDFVVLPRFNAPPATDMTNLFAQSAAMVASDPAAPTRWMTQLTHVRPAISRLDSAMSLAQVLAGPALAAPAPTLGQLPYVAGDRWLGLPIDPANPPAKGRVALACFTLGDPAAAGVEYAGLMIDEWPERIPSTAETASLAFHYEEPKARAPQACLLAVCPDDRPTWDADLVTGILEETLELVKIRTVDLSSLQQMGQILPALYFSLNLQEATVSVNFAREIAIGHPPIPL